MSKSNVSRKLLTVVGCIMAIPMFAQNVFVPGGFSSSGIGTSANGNVGIGISSPQGNLHLRDAPYWSSHNYGASLVIDGPHHNAIGIFDAGNSNPLALANESGAFTIARMPAVGNTSTAPISLMTLSSTGTMDVADNLSANGLLIKSAWNGSRIVGNGEYIEYRSSWYHSFYGVTNSNPAMFLDARLVRLGIGTSSPDATLTVNGNVHAKEVKVDLSVPGPDYVFEKSYSLRPLKDVKSYIDQNKHLPEVPSAASMEKDGINVSEMNMILLKKVEELTLYLIELKKENEDVMTEIKGLNEQVRELKGK